MDKYKKIGDLIYFISKELKAFMDEKLKDINLGQGQMLTMMTLMSLKDKQPISQEILAETMDLNKGNISRNLSKLSDKNLITIIDDNKDRRKKQIILNEYFYKEFQEISNLLQEIFKDLVKDIDETNLLVTLETLEQMKQNLNNKDKR